MLRSLKILVVVLLLLFYGLFLTHKIDLTQADLGRHLKNGEILFSHPEILKTNFYSYTHPEYPIVNHHWLSGLVFHGIHKLFGFEGLSVFFILLSLATFFLFFGLAAQSDFRVASLASLIVIPLLAERTEIRPEVFTYLFSAIFFFILFQWSRGVLSRRWLLLLVPLQILWVNLHIYLFLGPLMVLVFLPGNLKRFKELGAIFLAVVLVNLLNPAGLKGAFEPFKIFEEYGYRVV